ncbi:MAG: protein arginine kinase [Clostridia bacterium]
MEEIKSAWIDSAKKNDNIVVSSRIRIARNLSDFSFPTKISKEQSKALKNEIYKIFENDDNMNSYDIQDLSQIERQSLVDKRLISPQFAKIDIIATGLLVNKKGSLSVMINEEDHLRIQSIQPGLKLSECYDETSALDGYLEKKLKYAYDSQLGYFTSCITNLGTGLRASVMLHLPALVMTGNISKSLNAIAKLGFVARGIYGEGSETLGNMFQISNQITLGRSEEEIIANLNSVISRLVEQEKSARNYLKEEYNLTLEDQVGRALGILKYCQKITSGEAMKLLSDLRVGLDMDLISGIDVKLINLLIYKIQPASLQLVAGEEFSSSDRDIIRAKVLRQNLKGVETNDR